MQFAGLRDLLKKKKADVAPAPSTVATVPSPSAASDPYAGAIRSATANRQAALSASPATPPPPPPPETESSTGVVPAAQAEAPVGSKRPRPEEGGDDAAAVLPTRAPPLPRSAFEAEHRTSLRALDVCLVTVCEELRRYDGTGGQPPHRRPVAIPSAVRALLVSRYIEENAPLPPSVRLPAGSVSPDESVEAAVFAAALQEQPAIASSSADAPTGAEGSADGAAAATQLWELLHVLWALTAAMWRGALSGDDTSAVTATRQSPELIAEYGPIRGFSFPVYLLAAHALPPVLQLACGREIAGSLEQWRAARRTIDSALRLIAYLLEDYAAMGRTAAAAAERARRTEGADGMGSSEAKDDKAEAEKEGEEEVVYIVPAAVRDGLHEMLVRCIRRDGNYPQARQCYADLALGNANWKLGLFSGGEVHMRRSVEKLERNRIAHILNNEPAMRLLHAARELALFAEQRGKGRAAAQDAFARQFFAAAVKR